MNDAADDPAEGERRGRLRMDEAAALIIAGVERLAAGWVERTTAGLAERWGELPPDQYAALGDDAREAGRRAAVRVTTELRAFFALDPAEQRTTPLAIVRTLRVEATEVLARAGVPPVARDEYDVRAFPDDIYGIVPRDLAELGDDELGPALLVWGLGKATVLRARLHHDEGS